MKWTMFVERWPGGSNVEEANSGDRLKALASDIWKSAHMYGGLSKMRFTIYDPSGAEWQTCTRESGGSWRARWLWCCRIPQVEALEVEARRNNALLKGDAG